MIKITNITKVKVRFSEVDSMQIVWHGNYAKFLEDGREAFGEEFGLGYYNVYEQGFMTPIVKLDIDFKRQVKYGDEVEVKTIFENVDAAKIWFKYVLSRVSDGAIVAKGQTIQVFLDKEGELQITNPEFYKNWKVKNGLL